MGGPWSTGGRPRPGRGTLAKTHRGPRLIRPIATSYRAPVGEIGAQVSTAPADGKQFALGVSHRAPRTADHAGNQLGRWSHFSLLSHRPPSIQWRLLNHQDAARS